ncbi:MAG: SWIM zinc finger family protein, partial [Ilumatobacteraceae bacterium]
MSETASWTIEQVVAIAPTPSRFAAAEGLAVPARWASLGADGRSAWGRCRGTGREPYDTMVDHANVAWRCSCPSRSHPCKHALALLIMWVRGHVPTATAPAGVSSWVDGHTPREAASPPADRGAPGAAAPADDVDESPSTDGAPDLERARDERVERLRSGLVELDRWLDDRLRTGLADPALARYATWDDLAARLVDARAGALANRVRRLAGVVGARPDWHEVVLAELGVLHLLAEAGQRLSDLPTSLADTVATACGWQVRQADVLAGVPETDTWVVAGRSDTREDRIEVRRTWLHGL